ncbi:TetR/AcrR family transcriptional regulator [Roseibium polysiphoniae]|uniref:TetR/AcrR family transcriptional regulator n=1 Tax=Roseibium polysiphoniae TaxID=2571221 RepID=A0A944CAX3_9HYPH|nr:TetR/AcrR family transcriptional regulator [Roseibium polysiphoniae]MBS8259905.1 TetR/AcrR family transcriptional regulator [Roseibium polysiphoniae]
MTGSSPSYPSAASGRPQAERVTAALLDAALLTLAEEGFEAATVAQLAARARTSKQAVYRRWPDKASLIAASLCSALTKVGPPAPRRGSVAQDLRLYLTDLVQALQATPLGRAVKSVSALKNQPQLAAVLQEAEDARRLALRQIFIATPFEADMETRIDLLLGLVYFKLHVRDQPISPGDIEAAIHLVLGLTAPKSPDVNPRPETANAPDRAPVPFP